MENKLEQLRSMVIQEMQGELSEEDKVYLLQEASTDEEVREMRNHLWAVLGSSIVEDYFRSHSDADQANRLMERIDQPPARPKIKAIYIVSLATAAAAAIILLLTVTGIFRPKMAQNEHKEYAFVDHTGKNNSIQLKLNGQTVNLDKDTNQVIAGVVRLQSSNKTLSYNSNDDKLGNNQLATLQVPAGKDYSIRLSDGSEVQLNAATTLRFPLSFTGLFRDIYINGEAYIKVAGNPSKPFRVHLPNATIQVLGTEFNVNTYDSGTAKVALVEGKVKLLGKTDSLQLKPGLQGILSSSKIQVSSFDEYETLSWRSGRFIFNEVRFEDVCRVIPRLFGVALVMDNKENGNKRFTGIIDRNQPLELQLKGLMATNAISYTIDNQQVIHIRFK